MTGTERWLVRVAAVCAAATVFAACAHAECLPSKRAARAAHPVGHITWSGGCFYAGYPHHRRVAASRRPSHPAPRAIATAIRPGAPLPRSAPAPVGIPEASAAAPVVPIAVPVVIIDSFEARWAPLATLPQASAEVRAVMAARVRR